MGVVSMKLTKKKYHDLIHLELGIPKKATYDEDDDLRKRGCKVSTKTNRGGGLRKRLRSP